MWIIKEAENKITLIGIPIENIVFSLLILVVIISLVLNILPAAFGGNISGLWLFAIEIALLTIFGILLLTTVSVTITTIYETSEQFTFTNYRISGTQKRRINFNQLAGLIEIKEEYNDGSRIFDLLLPLDSGEKLRLCSSSSSWKWNVVTTKEKANKYLKITSEKYKQDEDDFKLTILDD
jgi:hypothetical protein